MSERERRPDFDELVGMDVPEEQRERLLRVHELLLAADPPPELAADAMAPVPPEVPAAEHRAQVLALPRRRRRWLALAAAAALLIASFGVGAVIGDRTAGPSAQFTVSMRGTPAAAEASASLAVYALDEGGNWPMRMTVRGLAPAASGNPYELWLTKGGKPAELCGSFRTDSQGGATVPMNAPYRFKDYDGWVVIEHGAQTPLLTT